MAGFWYITFSHSSKANYFKRKGCIPIEILVLMKEQRLCELFQYFPRKALNQKSQNVSNSFNMNQYRFKFCSGGKMHQMANH